MSVESRMAELQRYYDKRAPEYETLYSRAVPERAAELVAIENDLAGLVRGRRVLEIACGTGYWTEIAARTAEHVVATDLSDDMLELTRDRGLPPDKVTVRKADAYDLATLPGDYDFAMANFWLSHGAETLV